MTALRFTEIVDLRRWRQGEPPIRFTEWADLARWDPAVPR